MHAVPMNLCFSTVYYVLYNRIKWIASVHRYSLIRSAAIHKTEK